MSNEAELIREIKREKRLYGSCPHCGEDFRLCDAHMFSVADDLPTAALAKISELKDALKERREDLKKMKERMTTKSQNTVKSVNLGKILEKIVPTFHGFQFTTRDCRSLLEPIDYMIFSGLHQTGRVDSVTFLDVKSGAARLTPGQRKISEIVQQGKVELDIITFKKGHTAVSRTSAGEKPSGK